MSIPHIRKNEGESNRSEKGFSAVDFGFPSENMNVSKITLDENIRYPEKGTTMNTKVDMSVVILEGNVRFVQDKKTVLSLSAGDTVFVEKKIPYHWEPLPRVVMLVTSSPPWYPAQQVHSD